jgi:hypothetical protein
MPMDSGIGFGAGKRLASRPSLGGPSQNDDDDLLFPATVGLLFTQLVLVSILLSIPMFPLCPPPSVLAFS